MGVKLQTKNEVINVSVNVTAWQALRELWSPIPFSVKRVFFNVQPKFPLA